jgi:hypothetical protein
MRRLYPMSAAVKRDPKAAGATETSPVGDEHGRRLGRIIDRFGHEREIGPPLGSWPESAAHDT